MKDEYTSKRKKRLREKKELKKLLDGSSFEKGDLPALLIAALSTIFPFAIVIFLLLFLIPMLIFRFI